MESVKEEVPGTRERDFIAEMGEDLDIDSLHLEAALIFDRSTGAEKGGSLAVEVGSKEQAGLGVVSFRGLTRFQ